MLNTRFMALTLGTSLVVLSGCTSFFAPQAMPKGYKYEDSTPLSTPAPSEPWSNKAVITNTENMATNTAAWQGAVYELVAAMEPNLPQDGSPLNLTADNTSSNQILALDHYLRQTLIQKGYNLTTLPQTGTPLFYGIQTDKKTGNFILTTSLKDAKGDKVLSSASVNAVLPFEK